jgi:DNA invertase Pin-like site-specific DNA recombinase
MIDDAMAGKLDLIFTKSVSRFSRNTVDALTAIRQLKEKGCAIFFEKENINTLDGKGELFLSILSSIAQEESRNISENVAWGQRKRMADGKVTMAYKQFLGYEKGADGTPKIVESEAKTVRQIYSLFLRGMSYNQIARHLTERGIPTPRGMRVWPVSTVESILKNEKYRGDAVLQKTFTTDFLTKKSKLNQGELPQYHVHQSHPAIIQPEIHELVQQEIARRADGQVYNNSLGIFARRVICGSCGSHFGAKVWHSKDKYRRIVFQCNAKYGSGKFCATPHVTEARLKDAFVEALNRLITDRAAIVEDIRLLLPKLADAATLEKDKEKAVQARDELRREVQRCIEDNASKAQDQQLYDKRFQELMSRYKSGIEKVSEIEEKLRRRLIRGETLRQFIEELGERPSLITHFDEAAWLTLADQVTITTDGVAVFRFKSGIETGIKLR